MLHLTRTQGGTNMKKVGVLLAVLTASIPAVSSAGTAYFPHYLVNSVATQADGSIVGVYSAIHVSNVSGTTQTVTIELHDLSGTPLANHPVKVWNASWGVSSATTDASGRIQVTLVAMGALSVELEPSSFPASGWGKITGTDPAALIADVTEYGRLPAYAYPGTAYSVSYVVNGGAPF